MKPAIPDRPADTVDAGAELEQQLVALARSGTGAAAVDLPRLVALLRDAPPAQIARAGRLLARLDPAEISARLPGTAPVSIAVAGHGTLAPLLPALTGELVRHGLLLRPFLGDFDGYVFELSDTASRLYAADPDVTLCVLDPMVVFDELPAPWRLGDVERALAAKLDVIEHCVAVFEQAARGTLVLNTMPLLRRFTAQLIDAGSRASLGALWREANARLLRLGDSHPAVAVVDLDPLIAEGIPAFEARLSVYTRTHLSPSLLAAYAHEVGHLVRGLTGRSRKGLVLDLDGTVWGGVLGDDGVEGIEVSDGHRGEAFRAFQRVAKQLGSQGVLLAALSKNEPALVREALTTRADMTLAEQDFTRVVADWRPKHELLAELAGTLNLGVDGFVVVDDSPYECGLLRAKLPEAAVVQVDGDPAEHIERLLRDGWFDVRELTDEDRVRVSRYRDELERKDFLDSFDTIQDYLRELGVRVRFEPVAERDVPRVSQLTLRTNQFNLTTRRLQQPEVRELCEDPGRLVLSIRAQDRFGDNGLVGAFFVRCEDSVWHIDNAVLSCRVFSRGIEQACLAALLDHAAAAGAQAVLGTYIPSRKNGVVESFYPRHGFQPEPPGADGVPDGGSGSDGGEGDDGSRAVLFRHDLRTPLERPEHVSLEARFSAG